MEATAFPEDQNARPDRPKNDSFVPPPFRAALTIHDQRLYLDDFLHRTVDRKPGSDRCYPWALGVGIGMEQHKHVLVIATTDVNACHAWIKLHDNKWNGHPMLFDGVAA